MTPQTRLSAFKILNEVVGISLVEPHNELQPLAEFCRQIAAAKVNLIFFACGRQSQGWGVDVAVDSGDQNKITDLIKKIFPTAGYRMTPCGILSLFPHRSDPTVAGSLFRMLGLSGIKPVSFSYSNSAISVLLKESDVEATTSALFEPFQFSAFRTPADWKLAQEGKEQLYKEVVASYQEKKPKVYGLQWQEAQNLYVVELDNNDMALMGDACILFAEKKLLLPFLVSSPSGHQNHLQLFLSVPESDHFTPREVFAECLPRAALARIAPVSVFSMNGPHFGDRYGIVSDVLNVFNGQEISLYALGCAIASITGIVSADHINEATNAIKSGFDVPAVIRKK